MRHQINAYRYPSKDPGGALFALFGIIGFFGGLWGLIALGDPTVSNDFVWMLMGLAPLLLHSALALTHEARGLEDFEYDLLHRHRLLPKNLREQAPLSRKDVRSMAASDARDLERKMIAVLNTHNRDMDGPVGRTKMVLDSYIETYTELEA